MARLLLKSGIFITVCSALIIIAAFLHELVDPPTDMHLLGLLAALAIYYIGPAGLVCLGAGLLFLLVDR